METEDDKGGRPGREYVMVRKDVLANLLQTGYPTNGKREDPPRARVCKECRKRCGLGRCGTPRALPNTERNVMLVLLTMVQYGGWVRATQDDISRCADVPQPSVSALLRSLDGREAIQIHGGGSRRSYLINPNIATMGDKSDRERHYSIWRNEMERRRRRNGLIS